MTYQNIVVETKGRVGVIRLNRPQALNALNKPLMAELTQAIEAFDADDKDRLSTDYWQRQGICRGRRH